MATYYYILHPTVCYGFIVKVICTKMSTTVKLEHTVNDQANLESLLVQFFISSAHLQVLRSEDCLIELRVSHSFCGAGKGR